MKQICCVLACFILSLSIFFPIHVKKSNIFRVENTVIKESIGLDMCGEHVRGNVTTMPIIRYVTYRGNIIPPLQLPWQETSDGVKYEGILTLTSYTYMRKDDMTTAAYTGVLTY